jgi:hypothetical protein
MKINVIKYDIVKAANENVEEVSILDKLKENPSLILSIKDPTEEMKKEALTELPSLIENLHNVTEVDCINAVRSNGLYLSKIKTPTNKVILEALKQNGMAIQYVKDPTDEQIKTAILNDPFCIKHLLADGKLKEEYKKLALHQNGLVIQLLDDPTEELQLIAVTENPASLAFIKYPTRKTCIQAITSEGITIEYVKNPDENLQLLAIDNSDKGYAYRYIDNPTPKAGEAAYRKNRQLLPFIKDPTEEIQLDAVKTNITTFKYIKNPTKLVQKVALRAISKNPNIFDDVSNIDQDVLEDYLNELKFKEKSDKRMRIPEGLSLSQLKLYRFFQVLRKKDIYKTELKGEKWVDLRIKKILDSVKGPSITLDQVIEFKDKSEKSDIKRFILKNYRIARLEDTNKNSNIFEQDSVYFVIYVDAIKLLNLSFDKDQLITMSKKLGNKEKPYLPNQYILGYIRYINYKQELWLDDIVVDDKITYFEDSLKWLPEWIMSIFIREMRLRDINTFYIPSKELQDRFYPRVKDFERLAKRCYFVYKIIKNYHPLVNGKETLTLS